MSSDLASSSVQALDVGGAFNDALRSVVTFLPKLAAFLIILVIGWLVARLLRTLVSKGLQKVRFERAVQRAGLSGAQTRIDAGDLIARIVYYGVLLIALQLAFGVFGPNPVSDLLNQIVAWLPRAAVAIIIVVVAMALANAVRDVITRALGGVNYGPFVGRLASWFIIALGVIAALNQIGIATTVTMPILIAVLAALAGIAIVGVGGGLVRPMQQRWESWLGRAEREIPIARAQAEAYQRGREDAARAGTGVPAESDMTGPRGDVYAGQTRPAARPARPATSPADTSPTEPGMRPPREGEPPR
jgi:Mechanosensitive ion channel, conserved TM helix